MRLLLDTHTWLWSLAEPERLGPSARHLLEAAQEEVFLSIASLWELTIKMALGKFSPSQPLGKLVDTSRGSLGYGLLPIEVHHLEALQGLPATWVHRDPFDRMLVSQAVADNLVLVTADSALVGEGHLPGIKVQILRADR